MKGCSLVIAYEKEAISLLPCSWPCSYRNRIKCHRQGWHVIGVGRDHRECAERRQSLMTASAVVSCSQSGCHIQQKETAGKSPNKQRVSHGEFSEPSPASPSCLQQRYPDLFLFGPPHKNEHLSLPRTPRYSFLHLFVHYLLSPSLMG